LPGAPDVEEAAPLRRMSATAANATGGAQVD
jgi:hypothetical protein